MPCIRNVLYAHVHAYADSPARTNTRLSRAALLPREPEGGPRIGVGRGRRGLPTRADAIAFSVFVSLCYVYV